MEINKFASWINNGEETIIVNTQNQKCLILDKSGSNIWSEFLKTLSIEDSIMNIQCKYNETDKSKISSDVTSLYELLKENNIILEE